MNSGAETRVIRSCAKVNLTLEVLGIRPDGYHAIESVMQSISLYDEITLRLTPRPGISLTCSVPGIPTDIRNLAFRAASLYMDSIKAECGLEIHLNKNIPSEAGLGGGSSDAAGVLRGLNNLMEGCIGEDELLRLASEAGSDVPFFIVGGTAHSSGRGEIIDPLPDIAQFGLVIIKPPFGVKTPWAYRRFDEIQKDAKTAPYGEVTPALIECLKSQDTGCLPSLLKNDLEIPAVEAYPEIALYKERLKETGALGSLMCGSGSAVFGLFASEESARKSLEALADVPAVVFAVRTVSRKEALEEE
jgi:4-diphosphocytidyl-2-C-methyl-D-erythritol kinase